MMSSNSSAVVDGSTVTSFNSGGGGTTALFQSEITSATDGEPNAATSSAPAAAIAKRDDLILTLPSAAPTRPLDRIPEWRSLRKPSINPYGRKQATAPATGDRQFFAELRLARQIERTSIETVKAREPMMKSDLQAKYRIRARELRELAATMRNEHHRRLLLEAADGYEKICEDGGHGPCAENSPERRPAVT